MSTSNMLALLVKTATAPSVTGGQAAIYQLFSNSTFTISEPEYTWFKPTSTRLDELCALAVGWDGYRAPPVRYDNARFANEVLKAICGANTPAPQIVPGSHGDLQLEWHTPNHDIEIHVIQALVVHVWHRSPATGRDGEELQLASDFRPLAPWIRAMEGDIAVAAAAP